LKQQRIEEMNNQRFVCYAVIGKAATTSYLLYNGSASRFYEQNEVI